VKKKIEKENKENKNLLNGDENKNIDLGFKVFKLSPSNFKIWRGNEITEENLASQLDAFTNPVKEESKTDNMLYELMLKAGYLLTDKVESKLNYYSVNNGELIIALEELNQKLIDSIVAAQPKKVITLDNLFTGNDQLKTNTVLQMKDAGVYLKPFNHEAKGIELRIRRKQNRGVRRK
jgi:adenine-specific DNA-methyltransferase